MVATVERPTITIGTYLPKRVLTNEEIASWGITINKEGQPVKYLQASDIFKKTGVLRRHIALDNETVVNMGAAAARQILVEGEHVDFVYFSTSHPNGEDNALSLIDMLNPKPQWYMNIHAACSGFTFTLADIASDLGFFEGKSILVVASEIYSRTVPNLREERDPAFSQTIFSDGATAFKFVLGKDLKILSSKNYQFPEEVSNSIQMAADPELIVEPAISIPVPKSADGKFRMNGPVVYEVVTTALPALVEETVKEASLQSQDISLLIPHQGSRHMVEGLAKRMPSFTFIKDLEDGNFSSASIPKALLTATQEGRIKSKDRLVLAGFGAGLFASVCVVQLG